MNAITSAHDHASCNHQQHDGNENLNQHYTPVHVSHEDNPEADPFFVISDYDVIKGKAKVIGTHRPELIIQADSNSCDIDSMGGLDYIVLQSDKPCTLRFSACNTAVGESPETAVVSGFNPLLHTIHYRCSKKQLTQADVSFEYTEFEGEPITILQVSGGMGPAAVSLIGNYPGLEIILDTPAGIL